MTLTWLELKRLAHSIVFWLILVVLVFSVMSQYKEATLPEKPVPGLGSYGTKNVTDLEFIYPQMLADLVQSIDSNHFVAYPFGFHRTINLTPEKLTLLKELIHQSTSVAFNDLLEQLVQNKPTNLSVPTEESFRLFQTKVTRVVGRGSIYADDSFFSRAPMSYDDAVTEYNQMVEEGYSLSFARLFNDYAGIFISLIGWFIPIGLWYSDRKPAIKQTIYVKRISSAKLYTARLAASIIPLLVVLVLTFSLTLGKLISNFGLSQVQVWQPILLILVWQLPILFIGTSISSLITIMTDSPIAAPLAVVTWFLTNLSSTKLIHYGWQLVPRHNVLGDVAYFNHHLNQLLLNRALWLMVAILISWLSIRLLQQKREGRFAQAFTLSTRG